MHHVKRKADCLDSADPEAVPQAAVPASGVEVRGHGGACVHSADPAPQAVPASLSGGDIGGGAYVHSADPAAQVAPGSGGDVPLVEVDHLSEWDFVSAWRSDSGQPAVVCGAIVSEEGPIDADIDPLCPWRVASPMPVCDSDPWYKTATT